MLSNYWDRKKQLGEREIIELKQVTIRKEIEDRCITAY